MDERKSSSRKSRATDSSTSQSKQRDTSASRWNSNSKFNRILGNLERSIFGTNHNNNHCNKNESKGNKTNKPAKSTTSNGSSSSQQSKTHIISTTSDSNKNDQHALQEDSHQTHRKDLVAYPSPSSNQTIATTMDRATVRKSTLNKFQAQLASTLRPNQSAMLNKLSIPPPHAAANGTARNLLFASGGGNGSMLNADIASSETTNAPTAPNTSPGSSSLEQTSTLNRFKCSKFTIEDGVSRTNASPAASSSKSLPMQMQKSGSQLSNQVKNSTQVTTDDEESGFATYQSRRNLLANISAHNQADKFQHVNSSQLGQDKLIMYPGVNQAAFVNSNRNFQIKYPPNQQQQQHQYPHLHNQRIQHFVYNGYQPNCSLYNHQQIANNPHQRNQVPIMQTMNNNIPQNLNGQVRQHFLPNMNHRFESQERQNQLEESRLPVLYPPSSGVDCQQIYANAPPKPRRYQYYDGIAQNSQINIQAPKLGQSINNTTMITTMAPMTSHTFTTTQQSLPYYFSQQPIKNLAQHPFHNASYLSVPSLNQIDENSSLMNQSRPNINLIQSQQLQSNQALISAQAHQQLIKSKSSLDSSDLNRFRQGKVFNERETSTNMNYPRQSFYNQQLQINSRPHVTNFGSNFALNQRQQTNLNYLTPQTVNTNLHRSKSVSHLLPEYKENINRMAMINDQANCGSINTAKFTSANSSVNLFCLPRDESGFTRYRSNQNLSDTHPSGQQNFHNQVPQTHQQRPRNLLSNDTANKTALSSTNQCLGGKARSILMAYPNNGNRITRQSPAENLLSQEATNFAKQSLDDKIRHLLIGTGDSGSATTTKNPTNDSCAITQNSGTGGTLRKSSDLNNSRETRVASLHELGVTRPATRGPQEIVEQNSNISLANGTIKRSSNAPNNQKPASTVSSNAQRVIINASQVDKLNYPSNLTCGQISIDEAYNNMGNRQQRQYNISNKQVFESEQDYCVGRHLGDSSNSHLIVDLTTPRVLAKTQTNLLAASNQNSRHDPSKVSWSSINQSGLPSITSDVPVAKPSDVASLGSGRVSEPGSDIRGTSANLNDMSTQEDKLLLRKCERTAPYYYSDLKSEEQQKALRSIVQQKSLSPPPQLLSRSTDHSSTRLALRSATLHPNQAKSISENLTSRRSSANDSIQQGNERRSMRIGDISDFSSSSNIAKNIDKLFESPVTQIAAVQSMSALNTSEDAIDSSNHYLLFPDKNVNPTGSSHNGGDLKRKNFSKSKSLDNISQKSANDEMLMVNPVYENILRSHKLMDAIKDSTNNIASSKAKSLKMSQISSDESMDSILGSSLDDSDSSSDIIDELNISSTDNHLADVSQLIEQLKSNHSKLTLEYKSTLLGISKTISAKNKQGIGTEKNEKLVKRLQLLELKSKKCESRSKNQLALIQMMEKVLRQSKLRTSSNKFQPTGQANSSSNEVAAKGSSICTKSLDSSQSKKNLQAHSESQETENLSSSASETNASKHTARSSPIFPKPKEAADGNNLPANQHQSNINSGNTTTSGAVSDCTRSPRGNIIKTIVVESSNQAEMVKVIPKITGVASADSADDLSKTKDVTRRINSVSKKIRDIEQRNSGLSKNKSHNHEKPEERTNKANNPFCGANNDDSDVSMSSCENASSGHSEGSLAKKKQLNSNGSINSNLLHDDEDFIEFLSNSSHRSQFDASQFSASDFNTSTSTSASESSASCAGNDSLSDSLMDSVRLSSKSTDGNNDCKMIDKSEENGSVVSKSSEKTIGILKKRPSDRNHRHPHQFNNKSLQKVDINRQARGSKSPTSRQRDEEVEFREIEEGKFNNVFGNVIDVDVCPLTTSSSQCSNIDGQTLCLN